MANLAVTTCHFNWAGYDMPARNLRRFQRQMERAAVPVYGIELYLDGQEPTMKGVPNWLCYKVAEGAIMWQKEALLNAVEKIVPSRFDAIAAIDADVDFANPNWHRDTLQALKAQPVVQMFATANWTDRRGKFVKTRPSVARIGLDMDKWTAHPGFAWAFDRATFREFGGWYDVAPMGAGDTLLCVALSKKKLPERWIEHAYSYLGPKNRDHFDAWRDKVQSVMRGKPVGFVPGDVDHEWHGDLINRRYHERAKWIEGYDAREHVEMQHEGYLQWSTRAPKTLVEDMVRYFAMRDEDGTQNHPNQK